ncbi:MAG: tetratricopeptide repeat protein [Armatimonas sp.]
MKRRLEPADPFAPARVPNMNAVPPPPDLFYNGRTVRASPTGPVNTEQPDRDFFTDSRFDKGDNSGRLFYCTFLTENPHDPHVPERRVWFICWSPLNDGGRAQRLYNRPGYFIEEVTTDGKRLQVHHSAYVGERKKIDTYRWKGDTLGQGRFVLEGAPPPDPLLKKRAPFEVKRDEGYSLLSQRNYTGSISAFENALALKPRDAAIQFALGIAYEESGMNRSSLPFAKAIAAFGKAIAADPKYTAAYQHRAELYLLEKKYDPAIADMTHLLSIDPKAWEGYMGRARAFAKKGDYAKAVADTRKAAQLAPEEDTPWTAMALYQYRASQFQLAINSGQKALKLDSSETEVRITIACAYARLGMADKALKSYSDAKASGVSTTERRFGIRELQHFLKKGTPKPAVKAAVQKLIEQFIGPDQQAPLDDDEEIS